MFKYAKRAVKALKVAKSQVGYHEGHTANGWNNQQKYSVSVPGLEWSQGQSWCATFISWVALKSNNADFYPRTASCDLAAQWFKLRNQWHEYPAIGAQVFYGAPNDLNHTGIVYNYDDDFIYTVEGNTNDSGSREGDGVYLKKRERRSTNVIGYGYPKFKRPLKSADPNYQERYK